MFLLKKSPHRLLLLLKLKSDFGSGSGFSQIFETLRDETSSANLNILEMNTAGIGPLRGIKRADARAVLDPLINYN